ncbi:hypothetical protein BDR26DRAFT_81768 [Obelidium mucronatum]|nr:hypothetical protein BDR26DRAFT_81768 [Obelidium mucronatum]
MVQPKHQHKIRSMKPGEEAIVIDILATAFTRDEFQSWVHPDEEKRRSAMIQLFTSVVNNRSQNTIIEVTESLGSAAIWIPYENKEEEEEEREVVQPPPPLHPDPEVGTEAPKNEPRSRPPLRQEVLDIFNAVDPAGPPMPYIYLDFVGSKEVGTGGGEALIRHRLNLIDTDSDIPKVALWTGNKKNISYYSRFGFIVYSQALEGSDRENNAWWMVRVKDE